MAWLVHERSLAVAASVAARGNQPQARAERVPCLMHAISEPARHHLPHPRTRRRAPGSTAHGLCDRVVGDAARQLLLQHEDHCL
eukprot:3720238-Pyramimonas_sp.AAC.1